MLPWALYEHRVQLRSSIYILYDLEEKKRGRENIYYTYIYPIPVIYINVLDAV